MTDRGDDDVVSIGRFQLKKTAGGYILDATCRDKVEPLPPCRIVS